MKRFFYILFLIPSFFACNTYIELESPAYKPLPVINCLFTPDSTWKLEILLSRSLEQTYEQNDLYISDATVKIYENEVLHTQLEYCEKGIYKSDKKPKEGQSYRMEITTQEYGMITAVDSVPISPEMNLLKSQEGSALTAGAPVYHLEINDAPNQENYYYSQFLVKYDYNNQNKNFISKTETFESWYLNAEALDFKGNFVFSDKGYDGIRIPLYIYNSNFDRPNYDSLKVNFEHYIVIGAVSKAFMNYKMDIENAQEEHIYLGERPIIFSNIKGNATGIFAAYY